MFILESRHRFYEFIESTHNPNAKNPKILACHYLQLGLYNTYS
ncbi:hypothetical protein T36_0912 [Helicobacter cinaedi]|nr:hypothetical protein [Helicobacter cinaedi]BDB64460.1 hypothetical protein T36_0912 [Helicobacter cinaedi]